MSVAILRGGIRVTATSFHHHSGQLGGLEDLSELVHNFLQEMEGAPGMRLLLMSSLCTGPLTGKKRKTALYTVLTDTGNTMRLTTAEV